MTANVENDCFVYDAKYDVVLNLGCYIGDVAGIARFLRRNFFHTHAF